MEREAKAKVVASIWGAKFFQFLAALSCFGINGRFAWAYLEETVKFDRFSLIDLGKIASAAIK